MNASGTGSAKSKSPRGTRHLFVYGTLSPEHAPRGIRGLLSELSLVGAARLPGARLYDLGDYPGAVSDGERAAVAGQVFRLPTNSAALLKRLDEYEEIDRGLFVRRLCTVRLADGRRVRAWSYFYNRPVASARRIRSGRFRPRVPA